MRDRFSTLEFSPQGIPKWTTAQMSREWVETLEKEGRVKPWRNCQNCGATPASVGRSSLPRCGGCTDIQCADPPRYCVSFLLPFFTSLVLENLNTHDRAANANVRPGKPIKKNVNAILSGKRGRRRRILCRLFHLYSRVSGKPGDG